MKPKLQMNHKNNSFFRTVDGADPRGHRNLENRQQPFPPSQPRDRNGGRNMYEGGGLGDNMDHSRTQGYSDKSKNLMNGQTQDISGSYNQYSNNNLHKQSSHNMDYQYYSKNQGRPTGQFSESHERYGEGMRNSIREQGLIRESTRN
mmetsp:Transcript_15204/g.13328  ORF Transcript_15204/g.13328 Transcript_15204/m.13328 type:complete len:147 (+) Transcript_15204:328-768(+)|eukprot:CAMPEP_0205807038 /NCGR_PEP_ID=MMETSP0205-20121125/10706_1 /ASSEMBLY_ACC=CAM_ASM_000278 /TAXON_ID=36767 /ORGANISM="Euplotes focardii, Strain TN1" /LENGTH=146 /DNA_ID=CAMNT_0053080745 /DNA_START=310 /DNA_END=750 /DNA_ORIENTATION=-